MLAELTADAGCFGGPPARVIIINKSGGPILAFATGLTPCPLTTFIMTYAVVHEIVIFVLITSAAMASGMVLTIGGSQLCPAFAGRHLSLLIARTEAWRDRVEHGIEIAGVCALGVIAIGAWSVTQRLPA